MVDEKSFKELYEQYKTVIYNFAYRKIGDHGYAEEVTEDAFVALWKKLKQNEPVDNTEAYLKETVYYRYCSMVKFLKWKREHEKALPENMEIASVRVTEPLTELVSKESNPKYSERQQWIVKLKNAGLTHQEICSEMNISLATIKRELAKIRRKQ